MRTSTPLQHAVIMRASTFLASAAVSVSLLYLCVGVLFGLGLTFDNVIALAGTSVGAGGIFQRLVVAGAVLAVAIWAWRVARRPRPYPLIPFVIGLVVVGAGARGLLALCVDSQWSTDYLRYWQHAVAMVDSGALAARDLYDQRAFLIAYPVARLFGPDAHLAMKLLNVALLLAVQLLAYDMMRLARNHQAAQAMSIVLLAAPMPAFVALIPSHDLWGLFFLTVATWTATRSAYLARSSHFWWRVAGLAMVCALATYCLELQRTTGTLFALALSLASLLCWFLCRSSSGSKDLAHRAGPLVAVALVCLMMQPLLAQVGTRLDIHPAARLTAEPMHKMKLAAHSGAMGTATSDWYARFRDRFNPKASQDYATASEFARSLTLSTWILEPEGKLLHVAAHMPRMFDLGYPMDWDTALRKPTTISPATRQTLLFYAGAFGLAFGLALALALATTAVSRRTVPAPILILTVMVTVLSFLLLVLFENKAPNIFPIWLAGSMVIAWVASAVKPEPRARISTAANGSLALGAAILIVVSASGAAWAIARLTYTENDGRILDGWSLSLEQSVAPPADWETSLSAAAPRAFETPFYESEKRGFVLRAAPTDGARIQKYSRDLLTVLEFPATLSSGDTLTMTREVCGAGEPRGLEFFVFSPLRRKDVSEAFSLYVNIDGDAVAHVPIPLEGGSMRLVHIPAVIQDRECREVALSLTSNTSRTAASWRRASRTEIWFPRLVATATPD